MKVRIPTLVCSAVALLLASASMYADSRTLSFANRRADLVENKRVDKKIWAQPGGNSMMNKRFPIQHWDKHFSSVGSKRAPITLKEDKEKQMFSANTIERKEINYEMSRWNERIADLHKKAGIEMDDQAKLVADQQLYRLLQDTRKYSEMADEVSLRDLNRYQFRRNRSDDAVPVEQAGSGQ